MDFIEPFGVQDFFVKDLADIEDLGNGNFRFTFSAPQKFGGTFENVATVKIVGHIESVIAAVRAIITDERIAPYIPRIVEPAEAVRIN